MMLLLSLVLTIRVGVIDLLFLLSLLLLLSASVR